MFKFNKVIWEQREREACKEGGSQGCAGEEVVFQAWWHCPPDGNMDSLFGRAR
jgi:hypothetical protein